MRKIYDMRNMWFASILLLCCSVFLYGEKAAAAEEEVIFKGELTFYSDSLVSVYREGDEYDDVFKGRVVTQSGEIVPITIPLMNSTVKLEYEGSVDFVVYGSKGEIVPSNIIAKCSLDPSWEEVGILLLPYQKGRYLMSPTSLAKSEIPDGNLKLINFSAKPIVSLFENQKLGTKPRESQLIPLEGIKKYQLKNAHMVENEQGEWEIIHSSKKSIDKSGRYLMFVYQRYGNTGPWRMKLLRMPKVVVQATLSDTD